MVRWDRNLGRGFGRAADSTLVLQRPILSMGLGRAWSRPHLCEHSMVRSPPFERSVSCSARKAVHMFCVPLTCMPHVARDGQGLGGRRAHDPRWQLARPGAV